MLNLSDLFTLEELDYVHEALGVLKGWGSFEDRSKRTVFSLPQGEAHICKEKATVCCRYGTFIGEFSEASVRWKNERDGGEKANTTDGAFYPPGSRRESQ